MFGPWLRFSTLAPVLCLAVVAQADFTFDGFADGDRLLSAPLGVTARGTEAASVFGGSRQMTVRTVSGNGGTFSVGGGILTGSIQGGGTGQGIFDLLYSGYNAGPDTAGFYDPETNWDLSAIERFTLKGFSTEAPITVLVDVVSHDGITAPKHRSYKQDVAANSSFDLTLDSSSVVRNDSAFDASKVDYIQVNFDFGGTGSFRVDSIVTNVTPVPEPASVAALGLGALGVLRRRKRA